MENGKWIGNAAIANVANRRRGRPGSCRDLLSASCTAANSLAAVAQMIPYGLAADTARRLALAIVDRLGPDDVAAVIHTLPDAQRQNFTADRARLHGVIQSLAIGTSLSAGVVSPNPVLDQKMNVRSTECFCDVCSVDAVTQVATTLADVGPRPKVVFFIGSNIEPLALEKPGFLA